MLPRGTSDGRRVTRPTDRDYANLLRFRTELRRFDAWSHELGVLSRERDAEDARVVRLRLTELGGRRIDQLTQVSGAHRRAGAAGADAAARGRGSGGRGVGRPPAGPDLTMP